MALIMCAHAYSQDSWTKERNAAKALVCLDSLRQDMKFLTGPQCQGRATGTEGSEKAAEWIAGEFEKAGLMKFGDSWMKSFPVASRLRGNNVIGMLPGSKSIPCDRYIIVGAKYDHLGILGGKMYPGADYNASGTIAMTSLAEIFGAMRKMGRIYASNIIFVAFDASEYGLKGSESLWNMIEYERLSNPVTGERITKEKIGLMVNIDQIGCSLAPVSKDRKDYMIMLGTHSLKKADRGLLEECNKESGIDMEISLDYYGSANFTKVFYRLSDQRSFVDNKIPAVLFTSGITMNNNKTHDDAGTINYEVLQKRIWLMFHWLDKML